MKRLLSVLLFCMLAVYGCGGGGGGDGGSSLTKINLFDEESVYGTYNVTYVRVSCNDNTEYASDDPQVDDYRFHVGFDETYAYTDAYIRYGGDVLLDEATKELMSGSEYDYNTSIQMTGDYSFNMIAYDVDMDTTTCDIEYHMTKISDSVLPSYFRILQGSAADQTAKLKVPFPK